VKVLDVINNIPLDPTSIYFIQYLNQKIYRKLDTSEWPVEINGKRKVLIEEFCWS
jgi:hypothetical protein